MQRIITSTSVCSGIVGIVGIVGIASVVSACGAPPPKMVANTKDDGVPANSASEQRLASDDKAKTKAAPAEDPTKPYTTPLSGDPNASEDDPGEEGGAAAGASATRPRGKGGTKSGKGGKGPVAKDPKSTGKKVSKAECRQLFDKYIDLTVSTDSRFEGIPPEMVAQLKSSALEQAQARKGDPCSTQEVTRLQFNCAISAPTTKAWTRCMK